MKSTLSEERTVQITRTGRPSGRVARIRGSQSARFHHRTVEFDQAIRFDLGVETVLDSFAGVPAQTASFNGMVEEFDYGVLEGLGVIGRDQETAGALLDEPSQAVDSGRDARDGVSHRLEEWDRLRSVRPKAGSRCRARSSIPHRGRGTRPR